MTVSVKAIAALVTTAAAASAAAYLAMSSPSTGTSPGGASESGPSEPGPAQPGADAGAGDLKLCVDSGRVLHATPQGSRTCPTGQQEIELLKRHGNSCELCDPHQGQSAEGRESGDRRLAALEQRIRDLENSAYFEVVNQKEQTIFRVGPGGVRVFNASGTAVVAFGSSDVGGYFTARSTTAPVEASIGASGSHAGVRLTDTGLPRVDLGTQAGPYALRVPSAAGIISGIGETRAGTGAVLAGTLQGATRASLTVPDGREMASVSAGAGSGGGALAEATIGGGLLDIATAKGQSAVKMGHNGQRYGVVLAEPVLGYPLVPRSGLPGSYFMGCASGESPACAPTVP